MYAGAVSTVIATHTEHEIFIYDELIILSIIVCVIAISSDRFCCLLIYGMFAFKTREFNKALCNRAAKQA